MTDDNVIEFARRDGDQSTNLRCPNCGGEWYSTDGIVVDTAGKCVGYSLPLLCVTCEPRGLKAVK